MSVRNSTLFDRRLGFYVGITLSFPKSSGRVHSIRKNKLVVLNFKRRVRTFRYGRGRRGQDEAIAHDAVLCSLVSVIFPSLCLNVFPLESDGFSSKRPRLATKAGRFSLILSLAFST